MIFINNINKKVGLIKYLHIMLLDNLKNKTNQIIIMFFFNLSNKLRKLFGKDFFVKIYIYKVTSK